MKKEILDTKNFDVGDVKLTEKEKLFVFYFTYPDTDAFQCATKAARQAGYKNPSAQGYLVRNKEHINKAIQYVLHKKLKKDIEEEYHKIIKLKKIRIHYDIGEYVEIKTRTGYSENGEAYTYDIEEFKNLSSLTKEQRMAIDSIDYKGVQGIKVYNFADRDRAMADILRIYDAIQKDEKEQKEDENELTAEIIKAGLKVRVSARKVKEKIENSVEYMEQSNNKTDEL